METGKREVDVHGNAGKVKVAKKAPANADSSPTEPSTTEDVTFFHDFVAGGIAGSMSVVVGHPFDTIKVRMQTSHGQPQSLWSNITSFGGTRSLFRGMAAPLSAAAVVNAIIFSSYGASSRLYDDYLGTSETSANQMHDSTVKAFLCGSFAGFTQALVICPMEHIKCRLQIQHGKGAPDNLYKGPVQAARAIATGHGMTGLYRGWIATAWREVPAFGMYFAFYDFCKDRINSFLAAQAGIEETPDLGSLDFPQHSHTWFASALAGGATGALTWGIIYPIDIIKTRIQTAPLSTPIEERRMVTVALGIVRKHGWKHLFRGLSITLIRALPVNGIIFPVYEFCLMHMVNFG